MSNDKTEKTEAEELAEILKTELEEMLQDVCDDFPGMAKEEFEAAVHAAVPEVLAELEYSEDEEEEE